MLLSTYPDRLTNKECSRVECIDLPGKEIKRVFFRWTRVEWGYAKGTSGQGWEE